MPTRSYHPCVSADPPPEPAGAGERIWYHTIDLPDGSTTPGWYDTRPARRHVTWPAALPGGRALDVGTFDGFWAFELERQGAAEVVAIDVDDLEAIDWFYDYRQRGPELVREWSTERGPGFTAAADLVGSQAKRVACSVYDLAPDALGTFDVVVCGGLLEHLADPVRALERLRDVCTGELVVIEHLDPWLDLASHHIPAAHFNPDWDQWWRVNTRGLLSLVHRAGFDVTWVGRRFLVPFGAGAPPLPWRRTALHALAARRPTDRGLLYRALRARPRPPRPDR